MVTGLRAGCAHLCDPCYLVVAQLVVVAQVEYQLLPCRQGPYSLLESDALQVAVVSVFVSGHCIDSCARSVDGDLSLPAAFQYPQSLVRGDSVDPGFERAASSEPAGGPEYPDESLLSGVLRIIVRDHQTADVPVDGLLVPVYKHSETPLRVGLYQADYVSVLQFVHIYLAVSTNTRHPFLMAVFAGRRTAL